MKSQAFLFLGVLFALVLLVSSSEPVETSHDEKQTDKEGDAHHVTNGGGNGYGGGGYGGWGGYGGGSYGGPGGGGGWGGGPGGGGGGWGGGPGGGGGGWGGPGGGWGEGGGGYCRFGCCGWSRYGRGCRMCCRSITELISFNENEDRP